MKKKTLRQLLAKVGNEVVIKRRLATPQEGNRSLNTNTMKGTCGCEISSAKNQVGKTVFICSKCKGKCCDRHHYFNVDGNNISITKALLKKAICSKCLGREI